MDQIKNQMKSELNEFTADRRVEQLESELSALRQDFSEISKTLKNIANDKAEEYQHRARHAYNKAADRAQNIWEDVSDTGEEYYYRARDQFSDSIDDLNDCVREKPLQSLAIVAGIGFVIGFLTRR